MTEREADRTTVGEPPFLALNNKWAQKSPTNCEAKDGTQSGGRSEEFSDDMTEREANRTTEGDPPPVTFIGE